MADIFLSYSEKDRDTAQRVAEALQSLGWSVWWDRVIPAGETWREMIEEALEAMHCMVVLWSARSVDSDWVCEEAEEGRSKDVLVPVLIERVKPPAGFRSLQAADLVGWDGDTAARAFRRLAADIERKIGPPPRPLPPLDMERPVPRPWWHYGLWAGLGLAGAAVLAWPVLRHPPGSPAEASGTGAPGASAVSAGAWPPPASTAIAPEARPETASAPLPASTPTAAVKPQPAGMLPASASSHGTLQAPAPVTAVIKPEPPKAAVHRPPPSAVAPRPSPTPRSTRCADLLEREQAGGLSAHDLQALKQECR